AGGRRGVRPGPPGEAGREALGSALGLVLGRRAVGRWGGDGPGVSRDRVLLVVPRQAASPKRLLPYGDAAAPSTHAGRRRSRHDQRLDLSRVRGALELRLSPGDAPFRAVCAREGDAGLGRRNGTGGAGGPVRRVRVGRPGSKDPAAVPPHGDSEADRPLENAGPRQGRPLNPQPPLQRRFGLLHATALNMTNMIGIGPFITIPLLMSALGGPQAMLGWLVALVIVLCDSTVWSELGAALPGSGGSFGYLRQGYGAEQVGRLMGFLFVWQFVLSGPLEIASGYIGFAQYLGYIWKGITTRQTMLVVTIIGLANLALLYR